MYIRMKMDNKAAVQHGKNSMNDFKAKQLDGNNKCGFHSLPSSPHTYFFHTSFSCFCFCWCNNDFSWNFTEYKHSKFTVDLPSFLWIGDEKSLRTSGNIEHKNIVRWSRKKTEWKEFLCEFFSSSDNLI